MDKPIILVLGKNGQLGNELQQIQNDYQAEFIFTDKDELDITSRHAFKKIISFQPNYIINCAAYTAVDKAENETVQCILTNQIAVAWLAKAASRCNACLIQISSDYVYNTNQGLPIKEDSRLSPQGVYASSKANGEKLALLYHPKTIIIRASWIFSIYGNNFVKTMLRLAESKKSISVVNDQFGSPTYAHDLAKMILKIIFKMNSDASQNCYYGVYNFANEGVTSWYDFASTIFKIKNIDIKVDSVSTEEYQALAHRPRWSLMSMQKIKSNFGIETRHWMSSLKECLDKLDQINQH